MVDFATEGHAGTNFARRTTEQEHRLGLRQRATSGKDFMYVQAAGAIAAAATASVSTTFVATSGSGTFTAETAFAAGEYGWIRQTFNLPDEADEVLVDDTLLSWGVDDLQASLEYINANFVTESHIHALNDLSDVSAGSPSSGDVLEWTGSAYTLTAKTSLLALGDISDVNVTGAAANKTLEHNGTSWVVVDDNAHSHTLSDISDSGALAAEDSVGSGQIVADMITGQSSAAAFASGDKFLIVSGGAIEQADYDDLPGAGTIGGALGATDNVLVRSDGTGGTTVQGSGIVIDDSNNISGVGTVDGRDIAADGVKLDTITSGSNMLKSVYDPTGVNGDAFDADNIVEGTTNLFITTDERTALSSWDDERFNVASLAAVKALTAGKYNTIVLNDEYRFGFFDWDGSNLSADVTADTRNINTIPPNSDTTGASGAWVRRKIGPMMIGHAGVTPTNTASDNMAGLNAAATMLPASGGCLSGIHGTYPVTGTWTILNKGNSSTGSTRIELFGVILSGASTLVIDSCKDLSLQGLVNQEMDLVLRGCWESEFVNLRMLDLVYADAAGTHFTSTDHNDFANSLFHSVEVHASATSYHNIQSFRNVEVRGDATQGYTDTRTHNVILNGNVNTQVWDWIGCDLSYATTDVYSIGASNNGDVSMEFFSCYFDTKVPIPVDDELVKMNFRACQASNFTNLAIPLKAALRCQDYDVFNSLRRSSFPAASPSRNLVPNGDLATSESPTSGHIGTGDLLHSASGATLTEVVGFGPNGRHLRVQQATANTQTQFNIENYRLETQQACCVCIRAHPGSGDQDNMQIGSGDPTFAYTGFTLPDDDNWYIVPITVAGEIPLNWGGEANTFIFSIRRTVANMDVDIAWVTAVVGTKSLVLI